MTTQAEPATGAEAEAVVRESLVALAATKQHRLHPDMLARPMTPAQAQAIYRHLNRCQDKEDVASEPHAFRTGPDDPSHEAEVTKAMTGFPPPMSAFRHIPPGNYATDSRTGSQDTDFWHIDRPSQGKYAGVTFVERVIGGQENVQVRGIQARYACQAILAAGIWEASCRFGQELGYCGDCGRHLTDEESRRIGKGPVCRSK